MNEYKVLSEQLSELEGKSSKSIEQLKSKYKQKKDQFQQICQELQQTVPIDEFTRVNESLSQQNAKIVEFETKVNLLEQRIESASRELEQAKAEKKKQVLEIINAQQEVQDIKRDLELRDIKVESLQNIIKKRGFTEQNSQSSRAEDQQTIN